MGKTDFSSTAKNRPNSVSQVRKSGESSIRIARGFSRLVGKTIDSQSRYIEHLGDDVKIF